MCVTRTGSMAVKVFALCALPLPSCDVCGAARNMGCGVCGLPTGVGPCPPSNRHCQHEHNGTPHDAVSCPEAIPHHTKAGGRDKRPPSTPNAARAAGAAINRATASHAARPPAQPMTSNNVNPCMHAPGRCWPAAVAWPAPGARPRRPPPPGSYRWRPRWRRREQGCRGRCRAGGCDREASLCPGHCWSRGRNRPDVAGVRGRGRGPGTVRATPFGGLRQGPAWLWPGTAGERVDG